MAKKTERTLSQLSTNHDIINGAQVTLANRHIFRSSFLPLKFDQISYKEPVEF
jgi:hypothetical protein